MKLSKYFLIGFFSGLTPQLQALDFADTPLFLLNASIPNIVMMLDDSGSMNWEILTRRHYDACAYQPRGQLKLETGGSYLTETDIDNDNVTEDVVCFYNDKNYGSTRKCYDDTERNYIGDTYNDRWSSVRLRHGYGVRVFDNSLSGGHGNSADIASDVAEMPDGFDNIVSAFEIYRTDEDSSDCGNVHVGDGLYPTGSLLYLYIYGSWSLENDFNIKDKSYFTTIFGDWRAFSSSLNVTYFEPGYNYQPWASNLPDASFTAARGHGVSGSSDYNSTVDLTGSFYAVAEDDKGFSDSTGRPLHNNVDSYNVGSNGMVDIWDSYTLYQINSNSVSRWQVSYELFDDELGRNISRKEDQLLDVTGSTEVADIQRNFANWYQYYRKRSSIVSGAISQLINSSPNYRYSYGLINNTSMLVEAPSDNSNLSGHNENLLNDLFVNNRGSSLTPLHQGLNTAGAYLSSTGSNVPITEECQQNFSLLFTDGYYSSYGTFNSAIDNEDGDPYVKTLADIAHYYYSNDLRTDLDNRVPSSPADPADHQHLVTFPVAFGVEGSLNDTDSDGWPDVNGVQLTESDDWGNPFSFTTEGNENKINDMWHAAYNSKGLFSSAKTPQELVDGLTTVLAEVDKRIGSASSVATNTGSLRGNSRAYQARFNSATWTGNLVALPFSSDGSILNTPVWEAAPQLDVRAANNRVILTSDRNSSNALEGSPFRHSAVSPLSSAYQTRLSTGMSPLGILGDVENYVETLVDYLRGDSADESGLVQTDWVSCATENGTCTVPGSTTVRYGIDGTFVSKVVTGSVSCSNGEFGDPVVGTPKICEYAITRQYGFRSRISKLGDLIHSNPVYTGSPSSSYIDTGYSTFASTWASRAGMVYVGGNDGMLHGFDAATGEEKLAYVPYHLASSVYQLADPGYTHQFFVDGQITIGDVCTGDVTCSWKSMLAGGLRTGGRAIYALNVTDPSSFSEVNASNVFLWEFSSDDDADMGYFFGQPLIVKLSTGKWAVIVSNGYNSDNGKAVLYILDAETGQPLAVGGKLDTQAGSVATPNGLSSPTAVDVDNDGDVDLVYAGDLLGNMWKFDISSTSASNWGVGYSSGGSPIPLFSGGSDRPITVAPAVGRHPVEAGYMVYFGTGKYIEIIDNGSVGQPIQSFFGIWDDGRTDNDFTASVVSSNLLQQTILEEVELYPNDTNGDGLRNSGDTGFVFRLTSSNRICWRDCDAGADPHRGWRFDLVYLGDSRGEKQVTSSILRNGRVVFTTLQPSLSTCDRGGRSWLMELSASDGSYLSEPPFDLNQDGEFDASDVDYGVWGMVDPSAYCPSGNCQAPGGILIDEIVQTPTIMDCGPGAECKYVSGSQGGVDKLDENAGANSLGRQSWRELRGE